MELLRSLSHLLHALRKQVVPDLLSNAPANARDKVRQFNLLLQKDAFLEDAQAAKHFYKSSPQKTAFQKLKSKTRRALVANLMRLDFYRMNLPERRRNYYEVHREYAAIQILIGQRDREAAVQLAKRTLKRTEKYEFTDLSVALLRFLRTHYGIQDSESELAEQYQQRFIAAQWILSIEDELEYLYFRTVAKYSYSRTDAGENDETVEDAVSLKQVPLLLDLPSYRSLLTGTLIRSTLFIEKNDIPEAIACLDRSIRLFQAKPYLADAPLQMLYPQLINLYIKVRRYDQAERAVTKVLQYLSKQDFNWFKFQEQRFLLQMHTRRYTDASQLYTEVVSNPNFARMPNQVIEIWGLFEAYLAFLVQIGQLPESKNIRHFRRERVQKELKKFLKDKGGINLSFRIIDMIFALRQQELENLDNRVEALNRYRLRYLNQPNVERADLAMRITILFAREISENRCYEAELEKLFKELRSLQPQLEEQDNAFEIIPYEDLLRFVQSN
jgi:hypothetical protein